MVALILFVFVFAIVAACVRQSRAVQGQRQIAQAVEILLTSKISALAEETKTKTEPDSEVP